MAALVSGLLAISVFGFACGSYDDLNIRYLQSCEDVCDKYAFNSGGRENVAESCARGCRFFSILTILHDDPHGNNTSASCESNCDEAYSRQRDREACQWGCHQQQTSMMGSEQPQPQAVMSGEKELVMGHMLYPLLYMHSVYSNVLDKVHSHMRVSWSVYTNNDSGELVVVRSQPRFIEFESSTFNNVDDEGEGVWYPGSSKTSPFYTETNMVSVDNSATPLHSVHPGQMWADEHVSLEQKADGGHGWWRRCVIQKRDVGRLLLCVLAVFIIIFLTWFVLNSASSSTYPSEQSISIRGDLEYLRVMSTDDKSSFRLLHPQQRVNAQPLAFKIRLERV